jgi:hypothetical protein
LICATAWARFCRLRKNRLACHSEECRSDRDNEESRTALRILRARFLAPLGMTAWKRLSAASLAPPRSGFQTSVRLIPWPLIQGFHFAFPATGEDTPNRLCWSVFFGVSIPSDSAARQRGESSGLSWRLGNNLVARASRPLWRERPAPANVMLTPPRGVSTTYAKIKVGATRVEAHPSRRRGASARGQSLP